MQEAPICIAYRHYVFAPLSRWQSGINRRTSPVLPDATNAPAENLDLVFGRTAPPAALTIACCDGSSTSMGTPFTPQEMTS
jgi:hypothetical protein